MSNQTKIEELKSLLQKSQEYYIQLRSNPLGFAIIVCEHIMNQKEFKQECIIGTGVDTTQLRLDVTKTQVIFTLEDADTIIDSVAFDIQESQEETIS